MFQTLHSEATILARTLLRIHRRTLFKTGVLRLLNTAVQVAPPLLVAQFLRALEGATMAGAAAASTDVHWLALRTAGLLFLSLNAKTFIENQVCRCVGCVVSDCVGVLVCLYLCLVRLSVPQPGIWLLGASRPT